MKPIKWAPAILSLGLFFLASAAQADWQPVKRITWTAGESYQPRAAVDSLGHLYVVWYDYVDQAHDAYFKRSTDGGTSWSASQRLNGPTGKSAKPVIAVDSLDRIHVVWLDSTIGNAEVYYKRSTDGGTSWSAGQRLTWNTALSDEPALVIDPSDNLHLVWSDGTPGNQELFYKKSTDGGVNWSAVQRITWTSSGSFSPAIAVDVAHYLHVAWYDQVSFDVSAVYYKRSTDNGDSWSSGKCLSSTGAVAQSPDIAVDSSGHIYTAWNDDTPGNSEIYFRTSANSGGTWPAGKRLTWTSGGSFHPALAVDPYHNLHLVWHDNPAGNFEIYYRKTNTHGSTWTPAERLTWNSGQSWEPAIAIDLSGNIHVVWSDGTPGNLEIYYRKGQ